jgi:Flp pilus assembly protein TadG
MARTNAPQQGFLTRLARNEAGNTLFITAAALVPLLGLIGGGVDMSRIYLTKTRVQQACDAGALSGRKAMGVGNWTTGSGSTQAKANAMFDGNFFNGEYGTGTVSRTFTESNGVVTGNVTVPVPMTILKFFSMPDKSVVVSCSAKMEIPNTDVMFVLDVTGSMASQIGWSGPTKIAGLKTAVKCFYEALSKIDTTEDCGSTPSGTNTAQIRYGFVPYNVNVNVGKLLPSNWFEDTWNYQSREAQFVSGVFQHWKYKQIPLDISGLKNGLGWNNSVTLPIGHNGTNTAVTWDGCIEERQTYQHNGGNIADDWDPVPSSAYDMDIDMVPSGTTGSKWGPLLRNAVWARYDPTNWNDTYGEVVTDEDLNRNYNYYCPTEAKKMQIWSTASAFETYVNSLTPSGNTYHDIGMIWGARLISPTGLFASENATTPSGAPIKRNIIFMTDGGTNVVKDDYSAYGVHWWDRRQTYSPPDNSTLNDILNARLAALCTIIKNKNITLWVVSYGGGFDSATEDRLEACASPNKYFAATDTATLLANFKQIASEISDLRLTN